MYLFFDTETTGLPNYDLPLTDPGQPHILQLALLLTTEEGREVGFYKQPIKPEGFTVDEAGRAYEVNRLGNDLLNRYGVPLEEALSAFRSFQDRAELKVAHNYRFDGFLLKAAHEKLGIDPGPVVEKYCTVKGLKDAGAEYTPKSAALAAAYKFVTGNDHAGAHDALADVRACKDVFFWLKDKGLYKPQPRVVPTEKAA